jgi:aminomethyltransferase
VPYSSPFAWAFSETPVVLGEVDGFPVPLRCGTDDKEWDAVRARGGIVDLAWRGMIEIRGRDRVRFLHGMCTNDIKKLQPGQGCMAAIVNRQGKMVAETVVRALDELLLVESSRKELPGIVEALSKFLVADRVEMSVGDWAGLGIYGGKVEDILELKGLKPFDFVVRNEAPISRTPVAGVPGFDLWIKADRAPKIGEMFPWGLTPVGFETYERLRIANGFPRWGADMGPDLLPMEAGLEPLAVSYTKGCYIGQEVIQRVKTYSEPPRMLVQLALSGAEGPAFEAKPAPGALVLAGGAEVGTVTSIGDGLALAIVRKEQKTPGTRVEIEPGIDATVRALPWQAAL